MLSDKSHTRGRVDPHGVQAQAVIGGDGDEIAVNTCVSGCWECFMT